MEASDYNCEFDEFTERHYVKKLAKRHEHYWDKTQNDIIDICKRIDKTLEYSRADPISSAGQYKLVKLDFSIEGSGVSPKNSGHRCILVVDEMLRSVRILLVYSKHEIGSPNETAKWKNVVRDNFPDIKAIFSL